jgi:hypothetical protein
MKARTLIPIFAALAAFAAPAALAADPDASTVVRYLSPKAGVYQIELQNTSTVGYINTFAWVPPTGLTVTAVTGTTGGRCRVAQGEIQCVGARHGIAPPVCGCRAGASMTVTFEATGYSPKFNGRYWTYFGIGSDTRITQMTPVGYQIPSTMAQAPDLPVCAPGTQPSADNPCIVE